MSTADMSEDQTGPIEPQAPVPGQPAYAMPLPAGYPAYAVPAPRPHFADQVMGMRAVVATALACLIVGGLGGFFLGRSTGDDTRGFMRGPGVFQQRGTFPSGPGAQNGFPRQQFGQGQGTSPNNTNPNNNQNGR